MNKIVLADSKSFEEDVTKSNTLVAVYFYSEECSICNNFNPLYERMAEVYGDSVKFVKIFRQQNRDISEKYNVRISPSVLFIKDGEEVCSRLVGHIDKPEFRTVIEGILGGTCITKERKKIFCDVLILGGGPAGLSAAIYSSRAKLYTVVLDEGLIGGQVSTTYHVANYPGTNGVVRGLDLMENMKNQALSFGTEIDDFKEIFEVNLEGKQKYVKTEDTDYYAKTIILSTGAQPRKLPARGEKEFRGRGVHYCATCDGAMYQDANVLVVGGGNSAVEEAVFLTRYAKNVTLIHQLDHFQASKASEQELLKNPNIKVIMESQVKEIKGEAFVKSVIIENLKNNETTEVETDGVFVYIGMEPKTSLFEGKIKLSEWGYIVTDDEMSTDISGVYAAGDVREKKIRQISTATGDGTVAGIMVERFINTK